MEIQVGTFQCTPPLSLIALSIDSTVKLPVRGLFYGIGHTPNSSLIKDQVALDDDGYVIVDGRGGMTLGEGRSYGVRV